MLILLEMRILLRFVGLAINVCLSFRTNTIFLFSTLIVAEASLRMAILVRVSRSHGNDYLIIF
jgi:hypothetical protein